MKKIVMFVHCFPPAKGGLEYLSGEIKKILDEKYEVNVVTGEGLSLDSYKTFKDFTDDRTKGVYRLKLDYFWQRVANKFLNKIIFKIGFFSPFYFGPILKYTPEVIEKIKKCDVIMGMGMPTMMFVDAWRFARKYKKKLVVHPSYHDVSYYNGCEFFQKVFDRADVIIYQTEVEKKSLVKNYRIVEKKFFKLAFCPFSVKEIESRKKKTVNFEKNKYLRVGFVGQIAKRKKILILKEYLDKYLAYWKKKGIEIKVVLAGAKTNTSKEIESKFRKYIDSGVVKVIYNFADEDKPKIFRGMDVFVNPSVEESLGIVNFEAIFFGKRLFVDHSSAFSEFIPTTNVFSGVDDLHRAIMFSRKSKIDLKGVLVEYNRDVYDSKLIKLIEKQVALG